MKALSHRGWICHPSKCSEILMIKMRSICCTRKPVRAGRRASLTFCAFAFCCVGKFSSPSIITQIMRDYVRGGCCRKHLHWREQSLEMCDLYSTAPNAFVLLRSCISSAFSLSRLLSPPPPSSLLPSDALAPCGHSLGAWRSQLSDHFRCSSARLPPTSGGFPVPSLLSILSFPVSLPCLFHVCGGWMAIKLF